MQVKEILNGDALLGTESERHRAVTCRGPASGSH